MIKKFFYLSFSILTFYLAGIYKTEALMVLFFVEAALFLFMYLLSYYLKSCLSLAITSDSDSVIKGEKLKGIIKITNRGFFPIPWIGINISCRHSLMEDDERFSLFGNIKSKDTANITFSLNADYCGIVTLSLVSFVLKDYLTLFTRRKKINGIAAVQILPSGLSLPVSVLSSNADAMESVFSQSEIRGDDPPEIYQLSPYEYGDLLRSIEWKQSAKYGELYSKRYTKEEVLSFRILLDHRGWESAGIEKKDAFIELASAVSLGLLESAHPHSIEVVHPETGKLLSFPISDSNGYLDMIRELTLIFFSEKVQCSILTSERESDANLTIDMKPSLCSFKQVLLELSADYMGDLKEGGLQL